MRKRMPIPSRIINQTLDEIEIGVPEVIDGLTDPHYLYGQLIKFLGDKFGESRSESDLTSYTHRPWYVGIYRINPIKLNEALPYGGWRGPSPAHPVKEEKGAIWKSLKSGRVLYLPDVEEADRIDPSLHSSCTSEEPEENKMKGSEVVIPLFGQSYSEGRWKGHRSAVGAWDIDLNIKRIYGDEPAEENRYVQRLANILRSPGEQFFDMLYCGEPPFIPSKRTKFFVISPEKNPLEGTGYRMC